MTETTHLLELVGTVLLYLLMAPRTRPRPVLRVVSRGVTERHRVSNRELFRPVERPVHDTTSTNTTRSRYDSSSRGELVRRFAIVLATAALALVAAAAPAWAHVKVEPESAPKGSDAVLAFVVPNEKDPQTTTKVVVQFPTDHPIAEALVEPIAGWTAEATQFTVTTPIQTDNGPVTSAVKDVTWTATRQGHRGRQLPGVPGLGRTSGRRRLALVPDDPDLQRRLDGQLGAGDAGRRTGARQSRFRC